MPFLQGLPRPYCLCKLNNGDIQEILNYSEKYIVIWKKETVVDIQFKFTSLGCRLIMLMAILFNFFVSPVVT